jgi:predicted enzyme related to lactoylglutathione lyase
MTPDMEAARAFYADVLGWGARNASMPGMAYRVLTVEDTPVAGLMSLPEEACRASVAPHWIGYVGVDDVDTTAMRVKALGGTVHVPPTDVMNISRFSIIADPVALLFQRCRHQGGDRARRGRRRQNPLWPNGSAGRRLDPPLRRSARRDIRAARSARAQGGRLLRAWLSRLAQIKSATQPYSKHLRRASASWPCSEGVAPRPSTN